MLLLRIAPHEGRGTRKTTPSFGERDDYHQEFRAISTMQMAVSAGQHILFLPSSNTIQVAPAR
jgi:hypothetical protein